MEDKKENIFWPSHIRPEEYPVHAYNSRFIKVSPEVIWDKIINANLWSKWYSNCQKMKILNGENKLGLNTKFKWRTFHVGVLSEVIDFRPFTSLGWDAKEFLASGYHGWRLIPKDGGTLVVTEEVQGGLVPMLLSRFIKKSLEREHDKWLQGLEK